MIRSVSHHSHTPLSLSVSLSVSLSLSLSLSARYYHKEKYLLPNLRDQLYVFWISFNRGRMLLKIFIWYLVMQPKWQKRTEERAVPETRQKHPQRYKFCQNLVLYQVISLSSRFQWPRGLRLRSSAARLLRLCVRIPPGAWMSVCCECYVLSDRGLCDGLITRPEESYRLWRVVVWLWSRNLDNGEIKARYRAVKIQPQWVVISGKQQFLLVYSSLHLCVLSFLL